MTKGGFVPFIKLLRRKHSKKKLCYANSYPLLNILNSKILPSAVEWTAKKSVSDGDSKPYRFVTVSVTIMFLNGALPQVSVLLKNLNYCLSETFDCYEDYI